MTAAPMCQTCEGAGCVMSPPMPDFVELTCWHCWGSGLSAEIPCERCALIPTPEGKCICREVGE